MMVARVDHQELDVLVTVKAYPNPSKALIEAACIAGITKERSFVRLYPIPFRDLGPLQKFRKYQWIHLRAHRSRTDSRPETFRPDLNSITVTSEPLPTTDGWQARKELIMPLSSSSMCEIQAAQQHSGTSLGLFRPEKVLDFTWTKEETPAWTLAEKAKLSQTDLFSTSKQALLEKIPYKFSYKFRCADCRPGGMHHMKIIDWELSELYRKEKRSRVTAQGCLNKIRDKWLDELCADNRDTHFFTGNMQAHPSSFLILGVFYPPKQQQLSFFDRG